METNYVKYGRRTSSEYFIPHSCQIRLRLMAVDTSWHSNALTLCVFMDRVSQVSQLKPLYDGLLPKSDVGNLFRHFEQPKLA